MREICKPKIGLVGVMCTPFRGNKEVNYKTHQESFLELAEKYDFELHIISEGIYDDEQAKNAANEMKEWGADFVMLQTSSFAAGSFIYPFTEIPARLGLWSVVEGPAGKDGGLPLNSFTAANLYNSIIKTKLTNYPWPVKWFHGEPGQRYLDKRLQITVSAIRALINLKGARIGLIGGVAPTFDNLIIDEQKLKSQLDISVETINFEQMMQLAKQMSGESVERKANQIKTGNIQIADNLIEDLKKSGRMNLAIDQLADDFNLDAMAVSCWPQFQSEYQFAACSMLGNLNTTGLVTACEGDVPSAVSMLALKYLSNGDIVTLMDLVTVEPEDDSVLLWHCGPTPPAMADENGTTMQPLWLFDGEDGERIGLHNDLVLKPGIGTVLGFGVDFDKMLILEGEIDKRKPKYLGSKGWFNKLKLNNDPVSVPDLVQTLMASGYQHHYPFIYGSQSSAALELCSWLGIQAIETKKYTDYL